MLDYTPLWKLMEEKKISQYYLLKYCGIDTKTLKNMKRTPMATALRTRCAERTRAMQLACMCA